MSEESFYGVPANVLKVVGKVVVAAGRVEAEAHLIALALNKDTSGKMIRPTTEDIGRGVEDELMPHCTCEPADVLAWCADVLTAMQDRNARLHSAFVQKMASDGGRLLPLQIDRKSGEELPAVEAEFLDIVDRLVALREHGQALTRALVPIMRSGVHCMLFRSPGSPSHMVYQEGDGYPVRPTDEETDRWWPAFWAWTTDPARTWPPPTLDGSIA